MNLFSRALLPLSIGLLSLHLTGCSRPPASAAGESGLVEAWFDATSLNSIMSHAQCTHVRMYNARRAASDTKGTVIMIAVRADGSPIYNGNSLKYRMHDRFSSGTTPMVLLTEAGAKARIKHVADAGEKKYAANFKKQDIASLLGSAGCNGIRLVPELLTSGYWTLRMHPAKLSGTGGTINPAPPPLLANEPCPMYCGGNPAYYIHLP